MAASDVPVIASSRHPATHHLIELPQDEAALSVAFVPFHEHPAEMFVLVGTVTGLTFHPRAHRGGSVRTYRVVEADAPTHKAAQARAAAKRVGLVMRLSPGL